MFLMYISFIIIAIVIVAIIIINPFKKVEEFGVDCDSLIKQKIDEFKIEVEAIKKEFEKAKQNIIKGHNDAIDKENAKYIKLLEIQKENFMSQLKNTLDELARVYKSDLNIEILDIKDKYALELRDELIKLQIVEDQRLKSGLEEQSAALKAKYEGDVKILKDKFELQLRNALDVLKKNYDNKLITELEILKKEYINKYKTESERLQKVENDNEIPMYFSYDFYQPQNSTADIGDIPIRGSVNECSSACSNNKECVGFARQKMIDNSAVDNCWLKKSVTVAPMFYDKNYMTFMRPYQRIPYPKN